MNHEYVLMQYYVRYLQEVRRLSKSSIGHYTQALRKISTMLVERNKIQETVYEIKDINELQLIREYLYKDPEFVTLDTRGNRMYSSGLNNYYRFASGEELFGKQNEMRNMDIEVPVGEKIIVQREEWKRFAIITVQTLEAAEYKCEIDPTHNTFISATSGKQYMEGHHAIPMKLQDKFDKSIDVYANVICLCPICHRLLHHGMKHDKERLLNQIYKTRIGRMAASSITISKNDFIEIAI